MQAADTNETLRIEEQSKNSGNKIVFKKIASLTLKSNETLIMLLPILLKMYISSFLYYWKTLELDNVDIFTIIKFSL